LFPIIPILICWASHGITEFSDWASESVSNLFGGTLKVKPVTVQISILLIIVAIFITPIFRKTEPFGSWESSVEDKKAGLWIKDHKTSPPLIMAPSPVIAFYAEGNHIFMPDEEFSVVLEYAKRKKVNYLFVSQRRSDKTPEFVIPDKQDLPKELKLVYEDEQIPDHKTFIYQLLD
jgi:hypothetical protein